MSSVTVRHNERNIIDWSSLNMSREHPQLRVRIPPELKEELEDQAAKSNRTLTAEIVHRLQQSFANQSQDMTDSLLDQIIANKGGKPLDPESIDPEDIAQALVWVGEVQRSLITRMLSATKSKIDEQP